MLAGNQVTPIRDANLLAGETQAGLWFGKTDDLWHFGGKPKGWGGPWREQSVVAEEPSDPFLMTGFDQKVLHLTCEPVENATNSSAVEFTIEVDFLGNQTWQTYDVITVAPGGYVHHEFPAGFSAHWVRFTVDTACKATAYLTYT